MEKTTATEKKTMWVFTITDRNCGGGGGGPVELITEKYTSTSKRKLYKKVKDYIKNRSGDDEVDLDYYNEIIDVLKEDGYYEDEADCGDTVMRLFEVDVI